MFYTARAKELLATVLVVLFVMVSAYSAFAAESMPSPVNAAKSYEGKVIAIDNASKTISVRSTAGEEKMFTLTKNGQVFRCGKAEQLDTIKVGDQVKVMYFEKTPGNFVADFVGLGMNRCS